MIRRRRRYNVMTEKAMPRAIIVVARNRPALFEYLERMLAGIADIKVFLDRRLAPFAAIQGGAADLERRKRQETYDDLQERGFVIVRLS
ncbi:MAG: hypothetical protein DME12_00745 [Candidatus Rokuibacteriota bacterium]|nr:MAG: hypothetical protein DME12_00745 [Candidatus Rokubacteria bacterium]PYM66778.1 MAG: hypothetical protein DME11_05870 [Candidatus Rokubacteria bacterium]PYN69953.1 MAG: hypothetical protein DMD93_05010 [Candidatus Rokubacteria bacterium]